jgi:hypothetical protein
MAAEISEDTPVTEEELKQARSFLVDRLLPDLDKAREAHDAVQEEQRKYERLQIHLRDLDDKHQRGVHTVADAVDLPGNVTLPAER